MASLFNIIRACIYATVILFTFICLAMAGHFQTVLQPSDLTRFVPFAIFVCSASLLILVVLSAFSFLFRERNPISTRTELACLGLAGIFWLILGAFLVTSDSKAADVECFASSTSTTPLADNLASFHTDQYQAMYRVLMTFSLMNATIILFAALALLLLALRRHRNGDNHMWHGPVTSCAWFKNYNKNNKPQRNKSNASSVLPIVADHEKVPVRETSGRNHGGSRRHRTEPEKALPRVTRQDQSYTAEDFNNGTLLNPGRLGRGSR
ncbi:hypothetical protein APHAL10511_001863 [Amanita phalloides]|nr:hypothetical protein APHAL10511_001863 [Amanita phalloides]